MKLTIDDDFKKIAKEIIDLNYSLEKWEKIEADDYFQTAKYVGGFDATEEAFCFSYYDEEGTEYWFQLNLEEIKSVLSGKITEIDIRQGQH